LPSFYTEKTAEYTLVPQFLDVLSLLGEVSAVQFWKTREGNKTSAIIHGADEVYLVPFFARRPKIDPNKPDIVFGKIHRELFKISEQAIHLGVPVFCGISITNSIFNIKNSKTLWFDLSSTNFNEDFVFSCNINNPNEIDSPDGSIQPVSSTEILDKVKNSCTKMPWTAAIEIMGELYKKPENEFRYRMPFWANNWRFKPVYFIVKPH
jgi:hypothetical protein